MAEKLTTRDLKIHGFYIVLILTACLVFQTVFAWSKIPNVPELISFAVGLTSLVLAVIAIVQNLLSSPQLVSSVQQLSGVGDDIRRSTLALTGASDALFAKLSIIEGIPADVGRIKERVDLLSSTQPNATGTEVERADKSKVQTKDQKYEAIVSIPKTYGAQVAVYLLARCRNIPVFDLSNIFKDNPSTTNYVAGYLSCLRDYGYVSFEFNRMELSGLSITAELDVETAVAKTQSSKSKFVIANMGAIDAYVAEYEEKVGVAT